VIQRNSISAAEGLKTGRINEIAGWNLRPVIKRAALLLLITASLGGCFGGGSGSMTFTDDRGVGNQPFPSNYRSELLAFFRTYLTNPVGVRDAAMAEPIQRNVDGRRRYVSCVRYTARDSSGRIGQPQERAVVHVDARLDRVLEESREICAGAVYAPFPELEKMSR
jgi:hypothetical protein